MGVTTSTGARSREYGGNNLLRSQKQDAQGKCVTTTTGARSRLSRDFGYNNLHRSQEQIGKGIWV